MEAHQSSQFESVLCRITESSGLAHTNQIAREYNGHLEVSLKAQTVKNPPAMQETQVQSLGREDPLLKGMATHSSILAWRILWTEESGRLQSMGSQSQI